MLLMIDNYDSFTYNLVQYFGELKTEVKVVRNDELSVEQIEALAPERIVLSPVPAPQRGRRLAGRYRALRRQAAAARCLPWPSEHRPGLRRRSGAGAAGDARQDQPDPPQEPRRVRRPGQSPTVTRYHSLVVKRESLPECLEITAWTQHADGSLDEIMGVRHKTLNVEGVQFHPESILTEQGHELLANFLRQQGGVRGEGN